VITDAPQDKECDIIKQESFTHLHGENEFDVIDIFRDKRGGSQNYWVFGLVQRPVF
jgi:hypothetical protein